MINRLVLGTAKWGSEVDIDAAFSILNTFVNYGGTHIDTSTNYPINGIESDFGLAIKMINSWCDLNPNIDLKVFCKIGSLDNSGTTRSDLSSSRIQLEVERLQSILGKRLTGIGIHWDNRGPESVDEISGTLLEISKIHEMGYSVGFSGVTFGSIYSELAPNLREVWEIQVKETIGNCEARKRYCDNFPNSTFLAYGVGGKKNINGKQNQEFETPGNSNHASISSRETYAQKVEKVLTGGGIHKVILGPRNHIQLEQTLVHLGLIKTLSL